MAVNSFANVRQMHFKYILTIKQQYKGALNKLTFLTYTACRLKERAHNLINRPDGGII